MSCKPCYTPQLMPTPSPETASLSWGQFQSHVRYLPTSAQTKIRRAFERGSELHAGQKRRSGDPYFTHPIAVAHILADWGADADTIIAALLHDALEDTPLSEDEVEEEFGSDVMRMTVALTKLDEEELIEKPSLDEEIETIRKLFTAMQEDVRVIVIKLADRLHNMQTVEFLSEERQKSLSEETEKVYVRIADRLSMSDARDELAELYLGVLEPELLEKLLAIRADNEKRADVIIGKMKKALKVAESSLTVDPHYEPHRLRKLHAQLKAGGSAVIGVATLTVVFECDDKSACYQVLGALHQLWRREDDSFDDFINAPMINGYQGLHTTVILEDGTRVRCKIRTQEMQEYARRGITTMCFDGKSIGLPSYMGWAERISPLSADTADRSSDFWASLQSDILGESIIVHGPGDKALLLPEGSTALDGAFQFYGDQALKLKEVHLNGKDVVFQALLEPPVMLEAVIGKQKTVKREWLQWVQTGIATAKIREELAMEDRSKKIEEGKSLLEEVMVEKRRGLLAEFADKGLEEGMRSMGFDSVEEGYVAIAEGRMEAGDVEKVLFAVEDKRKHKKASDSIGGRYVSRFFIRKGDVDALKRLLNVYEKYGEKLESVRIWPAFFTKRQKIEIKARTSPVENEQLLRDVKSAGATDVVFAESSKPLLYVLGVALLLFLWGIDPVIGRYLVANMSVAPVDLTLIRFATLTSLCGLFLAYKYLRGGLKREAMIPLSTPSLWLSALLLVGVAFFTYSSLKLTWPSHYTIPMTAAGLVLTTMQNTKRLKTLIVTWCLFAVGIGILALDQSWSLKGMLLTVAAVSAFSLFSVVSERYKRDQQVDARMLQYFFVLSLICLLISAPLMMKSTIFSMGPLLISGCVAFSLLIASLPYYLYYYALSHRQIDFVLRYSFLIIFASVIPQWIVFGKMSWPIAVSALLVMAGATLPLKSNWLRGRDE